MANRAIVKVVLAIAAVALFAWALIVVLSNGNGKSAMELTDVAGITLGVAYLL